MPTLLVLAAADIQIAIISLGTENNFDHPTGELIARPEEGVGFTDLYRTDKRGTIEFITNGERLLL